MIVSYTITVDVARIKPPWLKGNRSDPVVGAGAMAVVGLGFLAFGLGRALIR